MTTIQAPQTVPCKAKNALSDNLTILLLGHTGSGKTAQIGELAEYYMRTTGKRTILYTADKGGWITIKPYVNLGIIEVVPLFGDVWVWLNKAVQGYTLEKGQWVLKDNSDVAMYAYEGFTSISDELMKWMADASSRGVNIGGSGSFNFTAGEGTDKIKIGTNNMGHYSVAQQQCFEKSTQSQYLPGTVLWTAGDRRGEDDAIGGVVGPQLAGKAMTGEVPRWFKLCFRLASEVNPGMDTKHVLYTDWHTEMASKGMSKGISNCRAPLAGGEIKIPAKIEPASIVRVLELLNQRENAAEDAIAKRLGLTRNAK